MPSIFRGSDNFDTAGGNAVKAWVNFNGTGTVAIRASYNVTSITDNGTGDYTVNFTTALADANYSVVHSIGETGSATHGLLSLNNSSAFQTSSIRLNVGTTALYAFDRDTVCISIFR